MQLRCLTNIKIEQQGSGRTKELFFDFVSKFESNSSWKDFTDKAKITLPKNLYYLNEFKKKTPLQGVNINVGGFSSSPLLLRGDKVTISSGYKYFNEDKREVTDIAVIFLGYISSVKSINGLEFECEDNMWLLKQTPVLTHTFGSQDTLEDILKFILKGTPFTVNSLTKTSFGSFSIGNETACQVLQRLRKTYGFESYFRGNELRCGIQVYVPSDAVTHNFIMNGPRANVLDQELEYMRKDDVSMSAVAHNTLTQDSGKLNKDGSSKTSKKRIEVLVTILNGKKTIKVGSAPENTDGERRTFFFPGAKNADELAKLAFSKLELYFYTGFKGSFKTFLIPYVKHGDNIKLINPSLQEQNGTYKVKSVEYEGGTGGGRQVIHLDYKINI